MKITADKVDDLTDKAAKAYLINLLDCISEDIQKNWENDHYAIKPLLAMMITECDELDAEDAFGTEGWRHSFGFDD